MKASYINPSYIRIDDYTDEEIKRLTEELTYRDNVAYHEMKRFEHAHWYANKFGREAHQEKLEEMKAAIDVCLLTEDRKGYKTLSGLTERISKYGPIHNGLVYPDLTPMGLQNPMKTSRYYQSDSVERLIESKHGAIELPTGAGKTLIIEQLIRKCGLRTLVIAPTKSIANQLYKSCIHTFGKKKVGMMGDGKKDSSKFITIAIKDTMVRVEEGSDHWNNLVKCEVLIVDESHTVPQETLSKVCLGVAAKAPYRFFVSATQMRNDGKDMLLDGIIGPIVYRKELLELVDEGYLARPIHYATRLQSHSRYVSDDVLEMTRAHIYESPVLGQWAADMANKFVHHFKHQVLILIDQVSQFKYIQPWLKYECGFAYGSLTKDNKDEVPAQYHNSDNDYLVDQFNKKKLPILIGTSCIATGTDIQPTNTLIYLMAGKSEIKFSQARGRATRLVEGKTNFNFIDYDLGIEGIHPMQNPFHRHFMERSSYCTSPVTIL